MAEMSFGTAYVTFERKEHDKVFLPEISSSDYRAEMSVPEINASVFGGFIERAERINKDELPRDLAKSIVEKIVVKKSARDLPCYDFPCNDI